MADMQDKYTPKMTIAYFSFNIYFLGNNIFKILFGRQTMNGPWLKPENLPYLDARLFKFHG